MRHETVLLSLVVLTAACGRTETYPGIVDTVAALDAGEPHCDRDGGVPQLLVLSPPGGDPAHWGSLDACINVTYELEAEPVLPELRQALADWTYPSCTWICFTAPIPQEDRPVKLNHRRIHLGLLKPTDHAPDSETATTTVQLDQGEIVNATLLISDDLDTPGKAPLLVLVGQVLGFEPTPGVDSVLNHRDDVPLSLTKADEQSVCAAYPTCR
ncbi:MAG: hypothetical protein QM723_00390 [Myxococcaceae bacterium]